MAISVSFPFSLKKQACIDKSKDAHSHTAPVTGAEPDFSKAKEYFGDHYERLQRIKRKYDPDVVFNKWFVIQPAAVDDPNTD